MVHNHTLFISCINLLNVMKILCLLLDMDIAQENSTEGQNSTYYVTEAGEYYYQTDTMNGQIMTVVADGEL